MNIAVVSQTQQTNTYLYLSSGERLPNIQADDRQDGKWDIQFDIDESEVFKYFDTRDLVT